MHCAPPHERPRNCVKWLQIWRIYYIALYEKHLHRDIICSCKLYPRVTYKSYYCTIKRIVDLIICVFVTGEMMTRSKLFMSTTVLPYAAVDGIVHTETASSCHVSQRSLCVCRGSLLSCTLTHTFYNTPTQ